MEKKKYFYITISGWTYVEIITFLVGVIAGFLQIPKYEWVNNVGWIVSIISMLLIFLQPIVTNRGLIAKAYPEGLLDKAISGAIEAANMPKDKEYYTKKYEHYLREIAQADKLNPIELAIDDDKFDNLFTLQGALSITNAPLVAWKDPEYNWFLVANYMATLKKRYYQSTTKTLELIERTKDKFQEFIRENNSILDKIKKGTYLYDNYVRFYILSKKEIKENKAMLEQMIAGHELFGIHLYVIDDSVLETSEIKQRLKSESLKSLISNNTIDVMIYKDDKGNMRIKYPLNGKLEDHPYSDMNRNGDTDVFIRVLAEQVSNNAKYKIYPPVDTNATIIKADDSDIQINLNQNYTFVKVDS